jgi:3-oxoacyl-[acyl-carrier-protein] synthase II
VNDICVIAQGLACSLGNGVDEAAGALLAGRGAAAGPCSSENGGSPFLALIRAALAQMQMPALPDGTEAWLATTVGLITELEASVADGAASARGADLGALPGRLSPVVGLPPERIRVVSSACASSSAAAALAASALRRGACSAALVIGCDTLSEFVRSGFSALMAVDPDGARPFDADRKGVTLGEAAACALLMRRDRAEREGRAPLGILAGWGMTCDANHPTGPSRDGAPLADAVAQALGIAGLPPAAVAAVCAHGTGTVYNDRMEMLAFRRVFGESPLPVFSVKGAMGHTLGAAGLTELLLSLAFLRRGVVPPTAGLRTPSPEAGGWVSRDAQAVAPDRAILTTNSGFGGTNVALVLMTEACSRAARGKPERPRATAATADGATAGAPPKRRVSPESQGAIEAVARVLAAAALPAGSRIGIIATGPDGSAAANVAYFADYVRNGRTLGRGQLFAATLATSVAADCAIACRLRGPLLYLSDERRARDAADAFLADGLADAFVLFDGTRHTATLLDTTKKETAS